MNENAKQQLQPGDVVRATKYITDRDHLGSLYFHAVPGQVGVVQTDDFTPEWPCITWENRTNCNLSPDCFEVVPRSQVEQMVD
jgi:hypothetical protein